MISTNQAYTPIIRTSDRNMLVVFSGCPTLMVGELGGCEHKQQVILWRPGSGTKFSLLSLCDSFSIFI